MKQFLYILLFIALLSSCGLNRNMMFQSTKGAIVSDSIPMTPTTEYKLAKDDKISCNVYSNKGHGLIDQTAGIAVGNAVGSDIVYTIRTDGSVELPKVGIVHLAGLTIVQCQDTLAKLYSKEYQFPYVQVKVTNTRVIIFPGGSSDARVIQLTNVNTTLMEVIATAGGINERGISSKIKLMRTENGIRKVYPIDLSKIENIKYADIIVQANDYIYVEPSKRITRETLAIVTPILSLFTSTIAIITIITTLK
jgi:polysaccharide biosynthesis/export protein